MMYYASILIQTRNCADRRSITAPRMDALDRTMKNAGISDYMISSVWVLRQVAWQLTAYGERAPSTA